MLLRYNAVSWHVRRSGSSRSRMVPRAAERRGERFGDGPSSSEVLLARLGAPARHERASHRGSAHSVRLWATAPYLQRSVDAVAVFEPELARGQIYVGGCA
jgi:hypothetical protein